MVRLPDAEEPLWTRTVRRVRKGGKKATKTVMRSHHLRIPKYDVPLRLRPWFALFTCVILLVLAFLGFTNFSHGLPLNDKLLHFLCLGTATAVFYFIFDVEEEARHVWIWRSAPLIITGIVCFFFGGIVSEIVQSTLPYKEFQMGDITANLLGSSLGLYISYHLERYYRHRREISRLYTPLNPEAVSSDDEEEDDAAVGGTQLLPLYHEPRGSAKSPRTAQPKAGRLADVWDEREELFDIGEESDEDGPSAPPNGHAKPKIIVSAT